LPRPEGLEIIGVSRMYEDGKPVWGWWKSQDRIYIATAGRTSADVQTTILHELLHVDEAYNRFLVHGSLFRYRYEFAANNTHPWIRNFTDSYNVAIRTRYRSPIPSLNDAPWR